MRRLIIGALAAFATFAHATPAGAQNGQFAVEEYGRVSCAQFNTARLSKDGVAYARIMGFVQGYLTAANRYEVDTFDLSPWHNAAAFDLILDKHCKDKPKDSLVGTVQMMVGGLRPLRVAKPSPVVRVSNGEQFTFVYETILRRAEMILQARGYLAATQKASVGTPPAGYTYTPEIRAAFRKYQQDRGLTPTGLPDPASLWLLLNP